MEQFSDDDFVPPTPKNQRKLLLLQEVSQNSKLSAKATSKNFKKPIQNAKRKKTSGISPDLKKFKDKTKQVTLFNYLKKDASSKETSVDHPAKVRLFAESKSTDVKNTAHVLVNSLSETASNLSTCVSFSDPENELNNGMFIEDDIDPKIKTLTLSESCSSSAKTSVVKCVDFVKDSFAVQQLNTDSEFSMNLNDLSNTPSTLKINEIAETNTKKEFQNNISEACLYSNEICKDVENLKLHLDERIKCTDYSLSNKVLLKVPEHEKEANKVDVTFNVKNANVSDMESSISWINDFDWKAYDNSMEKDISVSKDTSKSKISNFLENKLLFTVKEICKNEMNEPKLILETISGDLKTCILKGFWTDSLVNVGDSVHVLKEFENNQAVIDNHSGFLVINPDFLLSSTAIVSTLFCMRKAALNHILPSWSSGNDVMMIGNLVHDIFQQAVNNHASSKEEINTIFERVFMKRENLISLSCQNTIESELKEKVAEYIPSIAKWIEKHCTFGKKIAVDNLQVTSVEGIEDNVWSPKYGVKGKIDMTVKTFFRKEQISKILPLELKTGRATYSAEHIGQINLYILMLEENAKDLSEGLLLYLRDIANMKLVSVNHNSLRGLVQLRNELAFYTSRWISRSSTQIDDIENCHLPKPLNNKKFCGKCPYLLPCTVYQRALSEDKDLEVDHAMKSLITSTISHLTHSHLQYFVHWSNLLLIESSNVAITNAFWTEESTSREKKGMCLSWLSLDKKANQNEEINETFSATFCRSAKSPITSSLASVGLKTGDYIAVSKQGSIDEVAITMGYIVKILEESVTIISDRDFSKVSKYEDYIFRIDKQISNSATACIRNNLMCLMNNDSEALELRKFVIDKHPPAFAKSLPKDVVLNGRPILKELNKVQQRVVLKALMSEDYLIIKGMPGTGKTSTIVALVRLLSSMGNSVLLTSYTHSAIDNILLKLKDHMPFVRIGQEGRIHPNLKEFSFENWTKGFSTVNQFKTFMNEQMVVATTCLGINHAIFKVRKFDVCIVDEASQINQIACLGPLFHAKKFILVGDDKQLPPLVVNEKAREKGMQESLLQRLCNADNSMELVIQYRMNKEIMRFCNELTYNGALQCGSEAVAQSVLKLDISSIRNSTPDWVLQTLQVDLRKSVIFINTEKVNSFSSGMSLDKNEFESEIVVTILQTLSKLKVAECDVGIITPYRRQVDLIATKLKHINMNEIEVNTVDQYQGRDKSVIIISCVKCNKSTTDCDKKGVIINEEKRLNVAISRAKRKLIIIGCKSSLIMYRPFEKLIKSFAAEQIIELSSDSFPS